MSSAEPSPDFWRGKRVLVTGHTGFKGSWLAFWLSEMGADVYGLALPPENERCIFVRTGLDTRITSVLGDIRDQSIVDRMIADAKPEIVFHLAAQALVRRAHADPAETYSTNLTGLANVLDAVATTGTTSSLIVATSDKVYENRDNSHAFIESDSLGGVEPYGVSKAAGEFVVQAFRTSLGENPSLGVATVRAGNVIGGGDWAEDRLIPDAIRAFEAGTPLIVRNPNSTRPWQHVIDPLAGYILLAERLATGERVWRDAWNFGPDADQTHTGRPVREIADLLVTRWNEGGGLPSASWVNTENTDAPYEAKTLQVNSDKAQTQLAWKPRISLETVIQQTVDWYLADQRGDDMCGLAAANIAAHYSFS